MPGRFTSLLLSLGVALIGMSGCLAVENADPQPCAILEDCLCGETVEGARARCVAGENSESFVLDDQLQDRQCEVVLHQLGESCPYGTLELRAPEPDPTARCVHDRDCAPVCCRCGGSAAASVDLRRCEEGICMDAVVECNRRCLQARMVRGDPCEMLRRCRCAPLSFGAERFLDADRNGLTDLQECEDALSQLDATECALAAKSLEGQALGPNACFESEAEKESGVSLPLAACVDAEGFVVAQP